MKLENGVIRPFQDFVENKHALPPGGIRRDFSTQWKHSFSKVLEDGLKARRMESELPPTATPEQLKACFENCKVVLKERVSHFCDEEKIADGKVTIELLHSAHSGRQARKPEISPSSQSNTS